jgi:aspartate aminotransferase/aminotransferase
MSGQNRNRYEKEKIMKPLSEHCAKMPRSGIREIMELAAGLPDVIHLEVGEPNFETPEHIIEAAVTAARSGYTKYTPNAGIDSLREAIAEKLRNDNGLDVSYDNVVVTTGGVGGMTSSILATVQAGEEVLVPDPGWPNYESATRFIGAVPVRYPLLPESGFQPDLDALEKRVTNRSKLLLMNSPSNPTGAVLPRETVKALFEFAERHDLYVLSDEVYEHIIFEGEHVSPDIFDEQGRVIGSYSFSKSYAMTGWRVGYITASEEIARMVIKLQEPLTSCVAGPNQKAAEAALRGPQDCIQEMRASYKQRRDAAVDILKANDLLAYVPNGAFYILVDISPSGKESYAFSKELIRERSVAVAPGGTFGEVGKDYVRVSLATEENQLKEGLKRICEFVRA